jgi:hypothetical protein
MRKPTSAASVTICASGGRRAERLALLDPEGLQHGMEEAVALFDGLPVGAKIAPAARAKDLSASAL